MPLTPAAGEQAALRGFTWQYDHIARLVYDAIRTGELTSLRLTDPTAGQVDDLVLVRGNQIDAYQFKTGSRAVTFKRVTQGDKESNTPPLIRTLADAWKKLGGNGRMVHVHYFAEMPASTNDRIIEDLNSSRRSRNHFKGFLSEVLEPLRRRQQKLEEIDGRWIPALETFREQSGARPEDFVPFLQSLHFDLNAGSGVDGSTPARKSDLKKLSARLQRRAQEVDGVVEISAEELLDLMGWRGRTRLHSTHLFPVDLATYEPLSQAIEQLDYLIKERDSGYVAVVGPPGTGKSTLLTQVMSGTADRCVRYYAYIPATDAARNRLTGRSFLHDVVHELKRSGLQGQDRELTSDDPNELRRQRAELFDTASQEFRQTGRRTIIIVDGLDHVEREYSGNNGLLSELPRPDELPEGVLFVVGTRMLNPLRSDVRQRVRDENAIVDLSVHPLSSREIRGICKRVPGVSELGDEVHQLIAERSSGHPLSLSYLINGVREEQTDSALAILESIPGYSGDIAATYQAIWDVVAPDDALVRIFAVCSRLRIGFKAGWLDHILRDVPLGREKVQRFIGNLRYLFRIDNDEWWFFHDSFRQFAAERTALSPNGTLDSEADATVHQLVADFCAESDDCRLAEEELYHRYLGHQNDEVLALADQTAWRRQFQRLRSPSLIRRDMELVIEVAAERTDMAGMLCGMLGLVELQSRCSVLEDIDLPRAFYGAGLVGEAIEWCSGKNPTVPLAHRYNLAWLLGREGNAAGTRLFDSNEHLGLDEPSGRRVAGQEHNAALAWTRAAATFRPVSSIIQRIDNLLDKQETAMRGAYHGYEDESWIRYALMMQALIAATLDREDQPGLGEIDEALAQRLTTLETDHDLAVDASVEQRSQQSRQRIASMISLRVHAAVAMSDLARDSGPIAHDVGRFLANFRPDVDPRDALFDVVELLAESGLPEQAERLLDRMGNEYAFTASDLGFDRRDESADEKFRYWRLRYRLATGEEEVPDSIPPAPETPAGNRISRDAPLHKDTEAIEFAERMDVLVREFARIDAETVTGIEETSDHVWPILLEAVEMVPAARSRKSISRLGYPLRAPGLLKTAVNVAISYGDGLPLRLADELRERFRDRPVGWLATPLLDVLQTLRSAGVEVEWEQEVLAAHEASAAKENVYQKTEQMAELIPRFVAAGYPERAAELARELPRMAFAVGFRKDYQCDEWIRWYAAAAEAGGSQFLADGSWLAQLLNAAEPMTEGAPGRAANELPFAIARLDPFAAVRTFEYFVRNGTVSHFAALAAIVRALVERLGPGDTAAVALAADVTAHLISAGAKVAYPELAAAIIAAERKANGSQAADQLAESIAARTDRFALPTTRMEWRQGLELVNSSERSPDDDYHALVLEDGRRIAVSDAVAQIKTVNEILMMKEKEASESRFPWRWVVTQVELAPDDVRRLAPLFQGEDQRDLDVLVLLAEAAEQRGEGEIALSLANAAFGSARGNSWVVNMGGTRLRSAAIRVRIGGKQERLRVCQDLTRQLIDDPQLSELLVHYLIYDLKDIIQALDSDLKGEATWPLVRDYLEGIAEPIELGPDDPFKDLGPRWWSQSLGTGQRDSCVESTPSGALAELVVRHLSHPSWIISDATTTVIVQALGRGDKDVARAMARFVGPEMSDDLLEKAGRCLAAARARFGIEVPSCLEPLDRTLATHPSQVLRDLSSRLHPRPIRPLDASYRLVSAGGLTDSNDPAFALDDPYGLIYLVLAQGLGIDEAAIVRVAARHAKNELANLPRDADIQSALKSALVGHRYLLPEAVARRAAYGRVLADFHDAGLLDTAPEEVRRMLQTVDIDLIGAIPEPRPPNIPGSPEAGHDQTVERWMAELDERLQAYVRSSDTESRILVGARTMLAVLNWGDLDEEFVCGTTIGIAGPHCDEIFERRPSMLLADLMIPTRSQGIYADEPLVLEHSAFEFQQSLQAYWLAFRPDFAMALGWTPHSTRPGGWLTVTGDLAVETVWWVDGWWGHGGRSIDDTAAMGHAVLLTQDGLTAINAEFGPTTRHFRLTRHAREDGENFPSRTAKANLPLYSL